MSLQSTVFLVDDDNAVRDSLKLLVETAGLPVEAYPGAEDFLAVYREDRPGCLLLDVRMPGLSGPDLQAELARRNLHLPIVFLTAYGDIPTTVQAIKAGAVDFLTKPVPPRRLLERLYAAIALDQERRQRLVAEKADHDRLARLTPREREIAGLLVAGFTNKEVGQHLGISFRTVENHRARIMEKTDVANAVQLAALFGRQKGADGMEMDS